MKNAYRVVLPFIAISWINPTMASMNTKLPMCLKSPNCLSSQASWIDRQHYIAPFKVNGNLDMAWQALKQALSSQNRMVITHNGIDSLHVEATSLVFNYVDDFNIVLDRKNQLIHIRAASRIDHDDFGINRKRIEHLRAILQKSGIIGKPNI